MVELAVLKLFVKNKDIYIKYKDIYDNTNQDKEIKTLYKLIELYYDKYEDHTYISKDEFLILYNSEYPNHKYKAIYEDLVDKLFNLEVSRDISQELIHKLVKRDYATKIANVVLPIISGSGDNVDFDNLNELIEEFNSFQEGQETDSPFTELDLDSLIEQTETDGLDFRLKCLRKGLGHLSGGTLGHLFARPETGKTSFLHSEVSFIAPQLHDEDLILWFNNEEAASRILLRSVEAFTGMSEDQVKAKRQEAKDLYYSLGGRRVKLIDEATISVEEIERICKEYKPRFVVIDQGDKVTYRGSKNAGNTAEKLKGIYDNLREVVKRCNKQWKMDMLTVGQADKDAENRRILTLSNLDSGKTGKAGAFDYVIGIGAELSKQSVRYVTFCKNKIKGDHGTYLVHFDGLTGRYSD